MDDILKLVAAFGLGSVVAAIIGASQAIYVARHNASAARDLDLARALRDHRTIIAENEIALVRELGSAFEKWAKENRAVPPGGPLIATLRSLEQTILTTCIGRRVHPTTGDATFDSATALVDRLVSELHVAVDWMGQIDDERQVAAALVATKLMNLTVDVLHLAREWYVFQLASSRDACTRLIAAYPADVLGQLKLEVETAMAALARMRANRGQL
jgi:hypothetical protein